MFSGGETIFTGCEADGGPWGGVTAGQQVHGPVKEKGRTVA